jgi:hypothetical protein
VSRPSLPVAPPLEGDDRLIAAVITGGWVIALVVLLVIRSQLAPADRWWTWVAVAGCCIGAFGLGYIEWLKRSRARAAARQGAS